MSITSALTQKNRKCPQERFTEAEIDTMFADALGQLYIDKDIADKIKARLKESHARQQEEDRKELRRLQAEFTRKTNHLELIYQDRLDGTISKEDYLKRKETIEQDKRAIQADIEKLDRINGKYKEEGSTIIDLLGGFREIYQAADNENKAAILSAVIDKAVLRGGELHVFWKEPFDILFLLGERVRLGRAW